MEPQAAQAAASLGPDYHDWVAGLEESRTGEPLRLPEAKDAAEQLERLKVPAAAAEEVLAGLPSLAQDPVVWWLLERSCQRLVGAIGDLDASVGPWPQLPDQLGTHGRCFYILVYLAMLPHILAYHERLGIPDEVSWATLADLGRHVAIHHRMTGATGVDAPGWMTLHVRGLLYECGRLQYEPIRISAERAGAVTGASDGDSAGASAGDEGPGLAAGDLLLSMHIPEAGPLRPELCDQSLRSARELFDRCLPAFSQRGVVTCHSWLLDDQLAQYLPTTSNIVQFQRRFRLVPGGHDGDGDVLFFVFRQRHPDLDQLPQRTTLERAAVGHLRAGHHWRVRIGWLSF